MYKRQNGTIPIGQEERFRELALWMFVNDEAIHNVRPCKIAGNKDTYFTQSKDGKYIYAFLTRFTEEEPGANNQVWGRFSRKEDIVIKGLKINDQTKVTILGQDDRMERYSERHHDYLRIDKEQTAEGAKFSICRAQRLYNNRRWPNAIVLKIENGELVKSNTAE